MNAGKLKEILTTLPDDMECYIGQRSTNEIEHMHNPTICVIHDREPYEIKWTAKQACMSEKEWETAKTLDKNIVFWF